MEEHRAVYREEAHELLGELESTLLELERNPDDMELVNQVFRSMHTIKGSGAMFGFDNVAAFTHEVETVYDLVRARRLSVTPELVRLTLSACDLIAGMVEGEAVDEDEERRVVLRLRLLTPKSETGEPPPVPHRTKPPWRRNGFSVSGSPLTTICCGMATIP